MIFRMLTLKGGDLMSVISAPDIASAIAVVREESYEAETNVALSTETGALLGTTYVTTEPCDDAEWIPTFYPTGHPFHTEPLKAGEGHA